jgi:hypothetical protein
MHLLTILIALAFTSSSVANPGSQDPPCSTCNEVGSHACRNTSGLIWECRENAHGKCWAVSQICKDLSRCKSGMLPCF